MSMSALVRALGAAAGGISDGIRKNEDRKRQQQRDQWEAEDRAFSMSERARAVRMRDETAAAAAPVAVQQVEPAGPVMPGAEGAAGQPLAPIPTVQGKVYDSQDAAAKAADEANAPPAVARRMADVAQRNGDPVRAQQLRTGAMQEQAAKLKLSADERAELDARFNADLQANVTDWNSFDRFTSDSAGDGQGGKLKLKSVPTADGKSMVVNVIQPDGTLRPTSKVFPNSADGLALATAELARLPPDKKLAHLHQKAVLAQQAERDANTATYQQGMLKATQDKTAAGIELAQARAEAARAKTATGGAQGMTLADLKDGHKGIAATLNADWKTQIDGAPNAEALKAIKVARENEIATVQRLYTGAMTAGFGLTPEQAIVAFRSGDAAIQTRKARVDWIEKLAAIVASGADGICACDSSCLMHIGGGLRRRGLAVRPLHLAEILAS